MSENLMPGIIAFMGVIALGLWLAVITNHSEKQSIKEERFEQRCWEMNGVVVYANKYYCLKRSVMLEESK